MNPLDEEESIGTEQLVIAFGDCGWNEVLNAISDPSYTTIMSRPFFNAATEAENDGEATKAKVLRLLGSACSLMLSPENRNEPFQPLLVLDGQRSTIPDDFTDSEIEFFSRIVDSIDSPILKARLADLVWYKKMPRDINFALAAIDSYTQLPMTADIWFLDGQTYLQRAIDLCRMIRTAAGNRLNEIETAIINKIDSSAAEDGFLIHSLSDILLMNGLGDNHATSIGSKLESLAHDFDTANNFHASESFFDASSKWFRRSGDEMNAVEMTVAAAEAQVKEADATVSSDSPSYGVAASLLENAVQIYRTIPRNQRAQHQVDQRIQKLRLRINEHGQLALEEMATVSSPAMDISEYIGLAQNAVRGKSLEEALGEFANLHSIRVAQLRQAAINGISQSSFRALISKVFYSHDGRIIDRTPGISGPTPTEDDEREILAEMNFHYQLGISIAVQALIFPALDVLILEHRISEAALIELARRSPIVPIGRQMLFGKALAHGFNKDFATAIHLLGPQIENMVRFHLKSAGVVTSHLDKDGIEMEYGLSTLIELPETSSIFGEDLTYELKALYCDQIGPNLRNNVAHGLLDDRECYSIDSIYAWWLGLKIVFNVFWNSLSVGAVGDGSEQTDKDKPVQGQCESDAEDECEGQGARENTD